MLLSIGSREFFKIERWITCSASLDIARTLNLSHREWQSSGQFEKLRMAESEYG